VDSLKRVSALIHEAGLEVSMFTSYSDLSHPDPEERERQLGSIRWDVDAAVLFRTNIVRLTGGPRHEGPDHDEALRRIADGLRQSLDYAEDHGVWLALEDHPQIGTSIAEFTRILELVNDDRLKVNFDTSNPMEAGDDPVALVRLVAHRVVHTHLSDRSADWQHQVVGEGVVDFPSIFAVLRTAGYDGWLSLEAGGPKGREGIQRGIAYVRETWEGCGR
jgi:sugar phosphate isomerase/epimerase